jgi:hypothetical protein
MPRHHTLLLAALLLAACPAPVANNAPEDKLDAGSSEGQARTAGIARWRQARAQLSRDEGASDAAPIAPVQNHEEGGSSALDRWRRAKAAMETESALSGDGAVGHERADIRAPDIDAHVEPRTQEGESSCAPRPWQQQVIRLQQSILPSPSPPRDGAAPSAPATDVLYNYPATGSLNIGKG